MVGESVGNDGENEWYCNYVAKNNEMLLIETYADTNTGEIVEIQSNNFTTTLDNDGGTIYEITTDNNNNGEVVEVESNDYTTTIDSDGGTIYQITTQN